MLPNVGLNVSKAGKIIIVVRKMKKDFLYVLGKKVTEANTLRVAQNSTKYKYGGNIMWVIRLGRSDRFWNCLGEWVSLKNAWTYNDLEKETAFLPIGGVWIDCLQPVPDDVGGDDPC